MTEKRLANFELHELLGEGAMGQVYRAVDVHLDRTVAVKLLSSRFTFDPTFSDRFKREARLAAKLNHPNIATIYAFGEEKGEAYIAMEFVEGMTLEERLHRGSLSFAEIRKFGIQIASALDVAHAMGIIHRDIKPSNLMITRGGDIKVMDFGVARRDGDTQLTMDGALVGTANIMAPEIVKGGGAVTASDLFSLGCVLFEAIAGRPAFEGENAMAILYKVINEDPPELLTTRDDIPPDAVDLVHGLMIKDPGQRFGPARAVVERLQAMPASNPKRSLPTQAATMVLPEHGGSGAAEPGAPRSGEATPSPPPETHGLHTRNPWVWIGTVIGLAVLAGGLALFLNRGGDAPAESVALNNRGYNLWKSGNPSAADLDSAKIYFREAADKDPENAAPLANLGALLMERWSPDSLGAAEDVLNKAIERDPGYAIARVHLADLLDRTGRDEEAVEVYRAVLGLPGLTDAIRLTCSNNLGHVLLELDQPARARDILRPAIKDFPDQPALLRNLAKAYLALGDTASAAEPATRAYALDPSEENRQIRSEAGVSTD